MYDKIQEYDFEGLKQAILNDAHSNDMMAQRYAVRFIMLDNFDTFKDLSRFLQEQGVKLLKLETLLNDSNPDGWITIDQLRNVFKGIEETTLVTPFSELVRFYPDTHFNGFFNEISLLEDIQRPYKRIYVPLIGLQNRVQLFLSNFARIEESAPIWSCHTGSQNVKVFLTNYKNFTIVDSTTTCVINNFQEWLKFWKTSAPQPKVVCASDPVIAFWSQSRPDNIFSFTPIENAYQFLTQFLEVNLPFDHNEDEDKYIEQLLKAIDHQNPAAFNFKQYVVEHFNRHSFNEESILQEWGNSNYNQYDRWLLRNLALYTSVKDIISPYLRTCLQQLDVLDTRENLFIHIARNILLNITEQNLAARKEIMHSQVVLFRQYVPASEQVAMQKAMMNLFESGQQNYAIKLCTQTFDYEKRLAFAWYVAHSDDVFPKEKLDEIYPDLVAYMSDASIDGLPTNQSWVIDYLKTYRACKLKDKYEYIKPLIEEHNASADTFFAWYYSFKNSHVRLAADSYDKVYWIDGLGAEYIPYIKYLVESSQSGFFIDTCELVAANLPSSTSHNRYDLPPECIFRGIDQLAHDPGQYQPQLTLIKELDELKRIITQIINDNKSNKCNIAIVSDHGMSCLSRLLESKKYDKKAEHEGRYIQTDLQALQHDDDYVIFKNNDDGKQYKVALKHASIGTKPTHEVHGGCCPEEVVVPFIVLSNTKTKQNFNIKLQEESIPLSSPVIKLQIVPTPQSVAIEFEQKNYDMQLNGSTWEFLIPNATEGDKQFIVKPLHGHKVIKTVNIYGMGFGDLSDFDF